MAEKMANTIGRELRYFEYKFLKKQQSSKKGKKSKNTVPDGQLAWSDSPKSDDFRFTPKNEEFQKAMPGNKGEEELQMQVALAMSREEENERARRVESDKIRLEMAMKESTMEANNAKAAAQPSLLDISLRAPKPAAAALPGLGTTNAFGSSATNDPWGGASVAAAPAPVPTFDPFAPQQPPSAQVSAPSNGFGTANTFGATDAFGASNDAWGPPQKSTAVAPTQNPWGGAQSFPAQPATMPSMFPNSQMNGAPPMSAPSQDPWGGQQSFPSQPAVQNAFPTSQAVTNPWGTNPSNMFAAPNPVPVQNGFNQQNGAWGDQSSFVASSTQQSNLDPFGFSGNTTVSTAPVMQTTDNALGMPATDFKPPAFDPLKDFDTLHLGTNSEPAPILLQNDISMGKSVSRDIFPLTQVLAPEPINATKTENELFVAPAKKETELFLGQNSNLVNLDSAEWKTYKTPYCTKPLGTASHNPFQQTAPSKSLNEMKSVQQPRFT